MSPFPLRRETLTLGEGDHLLLETGEFPDLAPSILRQRLVIEGLTREPISAAVISRYLSALSEVCGMVSLIEPVTHRSDAFGWAGWIHWETSGAHFYAWEQPRPFFSVDIYTCKSFEPAKAISFTEEYLRTECVVGRSF